MWNPSKSVLVSSICTKVVIGIVIFTAFAAPFLVKNYITYTLKDPHVITPLLATIYACAVPGLIALFSLDRLLANIKKKDVFIEKNVKHLRLIS